LRAASIPIRGWMVAACDLRWMHGPVVAVAILTSPTLVAPRRALSQVAMARRLFEGPFGRSPGRNELRSQAATGPCGLAIARAEPTIHLQPHHTGDKPSRYFLHREYNEE